jgi:hypothetical protein
MDEDKDVEKEIKEKFDSLPKEVQEVIMSSNYEQTLIEIGQKFKLTVGQLDILARETTFALMGIIPLDDFEDGLTYELDIEKKEVLEILKDVNEKVFLNIRELLKLINIKDEEKYAAESLVENKEKNKEQEQNAAEILPTEIVPSAENVASKIDQSIEQMSGLSVLEKKISSTFQSSTKTTDHSLSVGGKTADPYRMDPNA